MHGGEGMSVRIVQRTLLCGFVSAAALLTACGGAETRKARHIEKGEAFLAASNFEKARVEFRNALQIAPNDSDARYENGVVAEKLGNPREAAQFYQGAIDINQDNVAARAALGRLYLFSGAPERALETIKTALAGHPEDAALLTVRAAARIQLQDPDGALHDAEHAVQLSPTYENAVAVLAGVYKSRNEPDKARVLLENAITEIPDTVDLRLALAQLDGSLGRQPQVEELLLDLIRIKPAEKAHRLRLAQYYARLNHLDEAERVLREAIKTLPAERDLKTALIDFLATRRGRDAAAHEMAAMLAANPQDYDLQLVQARFFEQGKEYAKAEAAYQNIIGAADFAAPGITARNRLAALKLQNNDLAGAEKLLGEVLVKSPRDDDALLLQGNLAMVKKDPKTAIIDLRAVLRDQPNAIAVMRTLARAHLANGEPALAEETMRRAVDANPKDSGARLDLAQLLAQMNKPEQAKALIDELVKQEPDNVAALDTQFRVAAATNDAAAARAAADAMVALQPKGAAGYYYQGLAAESDKRWEDALRCYSTSLELQPEASEPLQALARTLVALKRPQEALKRLDEVAARDPKRAAALNIKGEILMATQHPADAQSAFAGAIEREPKWWLPYHGLAAAQSAQHDSSGADATLRTGIARADDPDKLQVDLAGVLERSGKPQDSIEIYESLLRKDPKADFAANNLAMLLVTYKKDQDSLNRAKELAARFADSRNADYLDTYGWVLYKRGDSSAAVLALQTAVSKTPNSPISLYHLGMAQAAAGQADAARSNLTRSLQSGRNFVGMDEAKATLSSLAKVAPAAGAPRT